MESHTYYDLRKDGYIRPTDPDKPEYEQWRETPEMNSWKKRSAVAPKKKQATSPKAKRKPIRTCSVCGKPALETITNNLCREHRNAYQKKLYADIDAIREAQDAAKKSLLERLWTKRLAEYEHKD